MLLPSVHICRQKQRYKANFRTNVCLINIYFRCKCTHVLEARKARSYVCCCRNVCHKIGLNATLFKSSGTPLVLTRLLFSKHIPVREILPSTHSIAALKARMIEIVKRILTKHLKCFHNVRLRKHVPHQFSKEMSQKSEVVSIYCLISRYSWLYNINSTVRSVTCTNSEQSQVIADYARSYRKKPFDGCRCIGHSEASSPVHTSTWRQFAYNTLPWRRSFGGEDV